VKITRITSTALALPFREPCHLAGRVDYGAKRCRRDERFRHA